MDSISPGNEKILDDVKQIRDQAVRDADTLIRDFKWDQHNDLRITSLSKFIHLMVGIDLGLYIWSELPSRGPGFWKNFALPFPRPNRAEAERHMACLELNHRIMDVCSHQR